jgi:hypothetical protein
MTLPYVKLTSVDGAAAVAPPATDGINCIIGYTSSGPANAMELYLDIPSLVAARGKGPGVEAAAEQIAENGAVYLCSPTSDVAGVTGTPSYTGSSPPITATGTPNDDYRIRTKITTGGVIGTSQVAISLDGGNTYAAPVATAATIVLTGTGVTLDFAAGAYGVNDTASIDCSAPYYSPTNFTTAGNVVVNDPREFGTLLVIGRQIGADDAAMTSACTAMAAAAGAIVSAAKAVGKYFRAVMDAPFVVLNSTLVTAFAGVADAGVLVVAEPIDIMSPITQLVHKRPGASTYGARIASITPQRHPGEVRGGPLPSRVRALYNSAADRVTLDAARFVTFRTVPGRPGFYVTRGPTMAASGSDYSEHQFCRVSDLGSKVARDVLIGWLNRDLDLKKDGTGSLTDAQAEAIDANLTGRLREALVDTKYVVSAEGYVKRTNNVLTSSAISGEVRELRRGYASFISYNVGFTKGA